MLWKLLQSASVVRASSAVKSALLLCLCCGISTLGDSGITLECTVSNEISGVSGSDRDSQSITVPSGATITINFSQASIEVNASGLSFNGTYGFGLIGGSSERKSVGISDSRFKSTTTLVASYTNSSDTSIVIDVYSSLSGSFDRSLLTASVSHYVSWTIEGGSGGDDTGGDDTGGDDTGGDDTGGDDTGGDDTGGDDTGGDDTGGDDTGGDDTGGDDTGGGSHDNYDGRFYYTIDSQGHASGTANYVTDGAFSDYIEYTYNTFEKFREVEDIDPSLSSGPYLTNYVFLNENSVGSLFPSTISIKSASDSIPSDITVNYSYMKTDLETVSNSYDYTDNSLYTTVPIMTIPAVFSPSGVTEGYQYVPDINSVLSYFSSNASSSYSSVSSVFQKLLSTLGFFVVFCFLIFVLKVFFWK